MLRARKRSACLAIERTAASSAKHVLRRHTQSVSFGTCSDGELGYLWCLRGRGGTGGGTTAMATGRRRYGLPAPGGAAGAAQPSSRGLVVGGAGQSCCWRPGQHHQVRPEGRTQEGVKPILWAGGEIRRRDPL